jgi:hypothetical protein
MTMSLFVTIYKRTVDPRYFGELQKELESVVGKFQT